MKIISHKESRQILRNLYKREAVERYAERLQDARPEERAKVLAQIDREVAERLRRQTITGR